MMLVSIVIPVLSNSERLDSLRTSLSKLSDIEVLLVLDFTCSDELQNPYPAEKIIKGARQGRGYCLLAGFGQSKGEVVIFLHADTLLPKQWQESIEKVLQNPKVVGGGFSLTFDRQSLFLKSLIFFSNLLFYLTGELWGDRAIFFRRSALLGFEHIIDVPITEDIRLSQYLRKKGKLRLLKDEVQTSAEAFRRKGLLKHTFSILHCRWLYMIGVDPEKIYEIYYPGKKVKGKRGKLKGERLKVKGES